MSTKKLLVGATKETAGGFVRRPCETLLVESHDSVEALLDDTAHQKVELLQLGALIQGDMDVVLSPSGGKH